jgi:hypothetical protein
MLWHPARIWRMHWPTLHSRSKTRRRPLGGSTLNPESGRGRTRPCLVAGMRQPLCRLPRMSSRDGTPCGVHRGRNSPRRTRIPAHLAACAQHSVNSGVEQLDTGTFDSERGSRARRPVACPMETPLTQVQPRVYFSRGLLFTGSFLQTQRSGGGGQRGEQREKLRRFRASASHSKMSSVFRTVAQLRDIATDPGNRVAMLLLLRSTIAMGLVPVGVFYLCFHVLFNKDGLWDLSGNLNTHVNASGFAAIAAVQVSPVALVNPPLPPQLQNRQRWFIPDVVVCVMCAGGDCLARRIGLPF